MKPVEFAAGVAANHAGIGVLYRQAAGGSHATAQARGLPFVVDAVGRRDERTAMTRRYIRVTITLATLALASTLLAGCNKRADTAAPMPGASAASTPR